LSDVAYKPSPAEVKALREATQAGMMDCKRALEETGGDMEAAKKLLRERGLVPSGTRRLIKVLGRGDVGKALTVHAHKFSGKASEKLAAAGGSAETIASGDGAIG